MAKFSVPTYFIHWKLAVDLPDGLLQSVVELTSGIAKTNRASGREEDLNPGPPDYKSRALTTRPHRLLTVCHLIISLPIKVSEV